MAFPDNEIYPASPGQSEQTDALLRRILDEQMLQTQQLSRVVRAAQLYFWLTIIGILLGICLPVTLLALTWLGALPQFFNMPGF